MNTSGLTARYWRGYIQNAWPHRHDPLTRAFIRSRIQVIRWYEKGDPPREEAMSNDEFWDALFRGSLGGTVLIAIVVMIVWLVTR